MKLLKNITTISIYFAMLFLFFGFTEKPNIELSTIAFTEYTAKLNDDFSIILDESNPISENYVADISHFKNKMSNQEDAEQFISNFLRPFIDISLDLEENKAYISLKFNEETSSWTINEWNSNLKGK